MPTFDVVSKADIQEVKNAIDQATREAGTRYDFKGITATIEWTDAEVILTASSDLHLKALGEIFRQRLAKRGVSLKSVTFEEPKKAGGDMVRQLVMVKQGLTDEEMKKVNKYLKETKLKVSSQIQGDQLRVSGKKKDDLQEAIALLKKQFSDLELQFVNFRD